MVCIAAFIIFAFLGLFSSKYRQSAKKAWQCVGKKITFRPCDTSLKEDIKNHLVGKYMLTRPRLAKFIDRWIEVLAFIFVVATIWSLLVVLKSGLNLFVYDTCNPAQSQSCSLGAQACSIETVTPSLWTTIKEGRPDKWVVNEVESVGKAISLIPSRLKTWRASEYYGQNQTFYKAYDDNKPDALEIIDPSCEFCAKLFVNIKQSGFDDKYNLSYIAFPIPSETTDNGYKFKHSYLITSYLEAIKSMPLEDASTAVDWQILERIFTAKDEDGWNYQDAINYVPKYDQEFVTNLLDSWLIEFGYDDQQVATIKTKVQSDEVKNIISANRETVLNRVNTVNIPTLIFDGDRHDGVLSVDSLSRATGESYD